MALPSRRSTRAHSEWNVPIATSRAWLPDERQDPRAHLGRGLVGERHRQDLPRLRALDADEIRHPVGEHARLARPAPARISSGPSVVVTARACSGLRRDTIRCATASRSAALAGSPASSGERRRCLATRTSPRRAAPRPARPGPRRHVCANGRADPPSPRAATGPRPARRQGPGPRSGSVAGRPSASASNSRGPDGPFTSFTDRC